LLVLLALALALWISDSSLLFEDTQRIVTWVKGCGPWAPLAIIVMQTGQVLLAPIPGQVVGVAAGYLFGVVLGTLYSLVGTAGGSWIAFTLARAFGRPFVERLAAPQTLARLDAGAQRRGLFFFAVVFLLPFLPDDLACFAAGVTRIPIPALMVVAITARAPGILVSTWLGANAGGLSPAQRATLVVASALLAGLFLLYGERIQQQLMAHIAAGDGKATSRPPSREA